MTDACFYRVSIKALITDGAGKFLIAKEADGRWEFLGGGLEHGEEPRAGIVRELAEEAGLNVTSVSELPKYFLTSPRDDGTTFMANVLYEVTVADLDFTPSDECQELRFVSVEEASQLPLFQNVREFLHIFKPALHIRP